MYCTPGPINYDGNLFINTDTELPTYGLNYVQQGEEFVEMARQWIPGPRKGKRCRPSSASLMKVVRGQLEEVARLRWMVAEVVEIDLKMDQPFAKS